MQNNPTSTVSQSRYYELALLPLNKWENDEILDQIKSHFSESNQVSSSKKSTWTDYTRLYLNQYRKYSNPDSIGSKLLFSKFQDAYSVFSQEDYAIEFEPRSLKSYGAVANLNKIRDYDWDEFNGLEVWMEWAWDFAFYGTGLLDVSTYDKKRNVLRPHVQSLYLSFLDSTAISIENSRFFGRYKYLTYYEMINDGRFDESEVKKMVLSNTSHPSESNIHYQQEREANRTLLGLNQYDEPISPNSHLEIMEWFIKNAGDVWVVWTDNAMKQVLGYEKLKYKDAIGGGSEIPIIQKRFYKIPRSIYGIGIPDLVEDDHRGDVQIMNYMFEGIKNDSTPQFMFNYKAMLNPKDLQTRETNKNIPFHSAPGNEIVPFPKSNVVSNDTLAFKDLLDSRSESAVGTSKLLRGSLQGIKKSAAEIYVAKAKQDLLMAARSKENLSAEKRFWYTWIARFRQNMKDSDIKTVRIIGESGLKELKDWKKKDFVPDVDPDIKVNSSLASEPKKVLARRDLGEMIQPISEAEGNVREVLKQMMYLNDMRKDTIDSILPPTPHELRAEEENVLINEEKIPLIHDADDDKTHISVHMRAEDNKQRKIHLQAHVYNYLRKTGLPKAGEGNENKAEVGAELPINAQQNLEKTPLQSVIGKSTVPNNPADLIK